MFCRAEARGNNRQANERRSVMYIGIGTLVFILLVLLIIYLVRRA